jgi:signal transduction histidine kinase
MASKPRKSTLQRAQDEVQELLLELEAGTLDRITLEAGLNKVQERLKAMAIHGFWFEPESKQDDDPAPNRRPRRK